MKRRGLKIAAAAAAVLLTAVIIAASVSASTALSQKCAETLYNLGLFRGSDTGFELDRGATRAEAVTMLVRLLGAETAASDGAYSHPFTDVPAWAEPYIAYAYANGITRGVSDTEFDPSSELPAYQFMTMLLRLLGYSDSGASPAFTWDDPYLLAERCGMTDGLDASELTGKTVTRGVMTVLCANSLMAEPGSGERLYKKLITDGVFTIEAFDAGARALGWTSDGSPAVRAAEIPAPPPYTETVKASAGGDDYGTGEYHKAAVVADNRNPTAPGDNNVGFDESGGGNDGGGSGTGTDSGDSGTDGGTGTGGGTGTDGGSGTGTDGGGGAIRTDDGWSHVIKP